MIISHNAFQYKWLKNVGKDDEIQLSITNVVTIAIKLSPSNISVDLKICVYISVVYKYEEVVTQGSQYR